MLMINSSAINASYEELFEQWCRRWFAQEGENDEAADLDGKTVSTVNQNNKIWLLPGTEGRKLRSRRNITVNTDTRLLVIGGSSHAFPKDLGKENATCDELKDYVERIHDLWSTDGVLNIAVLSGTDLESLDNQPLEKVVICAQDVIINPTSYYAATWNIKGKVRMASIAHVHMFEPFPAGTHYIRITSTSKEDAGLHEPFYEIDVIYEVNAQELGRFQTQK